MAPYITVADWKDVESGHVAAVRIRQTTDPKYPSGWDYSLHLGRIGGDTILRYGNAPERTKGHERHTRDGVEAIEFPGMLPLYEQFKRQAEELSPVSWEWPE